MGRAGFVSFLDWKPGQGLCKKTERCKLTMAVRGVWRKEILRFLDSYSRMSQHVLSLTSTIEIYSLYIFIGGQTTAHTLSHKQMEARIKHLKRKNLHVHLLIFRSKDGLGCICATLKELGQKRGSEGDESGVRFFLSEGVFHEAISIALFHSGPGLLDLNDRRVLRT